MEIYVTISLISIFLVFFWFSITIYIDLPTSQLHTKQLITSQIRSHVEYLIQTYTILVLIYTQN